MSVRYLFLRNNVYYFRLRLPQTLRQRVGQREIKISLRTGDKKQAHLRVSEISLIVLPFIQNAILDETKGMPDLKDVLARLATTPVATLSVQKFSDGHTIVVDYPEDRAREEASFDRQVERYFAYLEKQATATTVPVPPPVEPAAPPSGSHKTLRTITQVFIDFEKVNTDERTDKWKSATKLDYRDTCQLYLEHIGEDKPFAHIAINEHIDFKNTLRKLPANRSKKREYRDLSIRELIAMEIPAEHLMSLSTINNHITRLNALTNWLNGERKADLPVIKKLAASKTLQARDARAVFTGDDIRALFNHPIYTHNEFKHDYYYWLIPLGLYTGCRLRELCQLETKDIQMCEESGIWYFDINTDVSPELQPLGVIKSLKTTPARRIIPIHSHLVELGFLKFVDSRRHPEQSAFLFNIKPNAEGDCSIPASKWFQRYRKNINFDVSKGRKDFHSLRHTLINSLYEHEVSELVNKDVVGHAHTSVNTNTYRKSAKLMILKKGIERIDYRSIMTEVQPWSKV